MKAMSLTQDHFITSNVTLVGFSGERARALGAIKLSIILGIAPQHVTTVAEFLVLNSSCTYNAILERGTLNEIWFVIAMYYLIVHGVGEIKGNQAEARSCVCGIVRRQAKINRFNDGGE